MKFEKLIEGFMVDKMVVQEILHDYFSFVEDLNKHAQEEKIVNDFLSTIPEASIVSIRDIDVQVGHIEAELRKNTAVLRQFVEAVKEECKLKMHYFSFTYIPNLIVKRKINKNDFEMVKKLLL